MVRKICVLGIPDHIHINRVFGGFLLGYLTAKQMGEISFISSAATDGASMYTLSTFPWARLSDYDVLLTLGQTKNSVKPHLDNMTGAQAKNITEFVKSGKGCVVIHVAIVHFNDEFTDMVGGSFLWHPPIHEFTVEVVDPNHPITRGVKAFRVKDELYFTECDHSTIRVLLSASYQGKKSLDGREFNVVENHVPMMWVKTFGKGRVVYIAPGHNLQTFQNLSYLRLIERAILWASHSL